ncbi:uncharacterized protein [Nicotiana tomentosiformis]|uniref:uncharacterized protein n=1 Tax=Nicotiana tomentosiformis TaxID=4098 RepID=UPI00388C38BE
MLTTFKQANIHEEWRQDMKAEYDALMRNQTWKLVPRAPMKNIVDRKWLYRIKRKSDGSIDRYKDCLVAKGFSQRPNLNLYETFSPVDKPTTVRMFMQNSTDEHTKAVKGILRYLKATATSSLRILRTRTTIFTCILMQIESVTRMTEYPLQHFNPVFHSRMKHITVDFSYVGNQVQAHQILVKHTDACDQLADTLTKPLPKPAFAMCRSKLGIVAPHLT